MRILVLSDSHGNSSALARAVREQPAAELILFLGDGAEEAEALKKSLPKEKQMMIVRGNNDWCCTAPDIGEIVAQETKIVFTHGHLYGVKYGLERLTGLARSRGAKIVLFGHTHRALTTYEDGLYVMNPGALRGSFESEPSYGTIDLSPAGILPNIVTL